MNEKVEIDASYWMNVQSLPRDFERDDQSASRIIAQSRNVPRRHRAGKPRLCVCQTQLLRRDAIRAVVRINAGAVVFHFNTHHAISRRRSDLNTAGGRVSDRMSHRILDDRLQNQIGNANIQHFRIDVNVSREAILKTNALDLEIAVQKLDLLLQRHFHRAGVFERQSEEVAEPRDHLARAFSVFAQQSRNGMQRVEEKMRMNLHFQGFQLRLHELRAKLRSFQLTFAITVVVVERVAHQQDEPVNQQPVIEVVVDKIEDPERL